MEFLQEGITPWFLEQFAKGMCCCMILCGVGLSVEMDREIPELISALAFIMTITSISATLSMQVT